MNLHDLFAGSQPPEELSFERSLTDEALRTLAPVEPPVDLALRIRLAISHERVRAERRLGGRLLHRLQVFRENALRPIALQLGVAAGALAVLCASVFVLGAVTPQQAVRADDIPLAGFSAPQYLYSIGGEQRVGSIDDQPLIVQAKIDRGGRVYDYRVLSGTLDREAESALRQRLLTSVFKPAKVFDEPSPGTVLLTFADVVVRG